MNPGSAPGFQFTTILLPLGISELYLLVYGDIQINIDNVYLNIFNSMGHIQNYHISLSEVLYISELYHHNTIPLYGSNQSIYVPFSIIHNQIILMKILLEPFIETRLGILSRNSGTP